MPSSTVDGIRIGVPLASAKGRGDQQPAPNLVGLDSSPVSVAPGQGDNRLSLAPPRTRQCPSPPSQCPPDRGSARRPVPAGAWRGGKRRGPLEQDAEIYNRMG